MKKEGVLLVFLIAILIFSSSYVFAEKYINAEFSIEENGFVNVEGEADENPEINGINFSEGKLEGTTQLLTLKQGGKWSFSLSLKEYEAISLKIIFPENTEKIENIETELNYNINLGKKIEVEILDSEKIIDFKVDYSLGGGNETDWLISLILVLIILVLIVFIVIRKEKQVKKIDVIKKMLNENEEKIVKLLEKKPYRQKELRKELEIPKASFSRYIFNLEKKRIIVREGEGKNKFVRLK